MWIIKSVLSQSDNFDVHTHKVWNKFYFEESERRQFVTDVEQTQKRDSTFWKEVNFVSFRFVLLSEFSCFVVEAVNNFTETLESL
jgi:hypothetical protein